MSDIHFPDIYFGKDKGYFSTPKPSNTVTGNCFYSRAGWRYFEVTAG
jgi:hypothetical protein